jgi:hypothetical protein
LLVDTDAMEGNIDIVKQWSTVWFICRMSFSYFFNAPYVCALKRWTNSWICKASYGLIHFVIEGSSSKWRWKGVAGSFWKD